MSQAQIKALNSRITELEDQLKAHQQQIVNTCASQLQSLFQNPVLVDSLAHRLLIAGANAIAHKVKTSQERAPELTVLEGYIPGALRAILNEDGSMSVEQQLKGATNAGGNWESATAFYEEKGILEQFTQLMAAFGASAGRVYYISDTVTVAAHRDKLAREMAANVRATDEEQDPSASGESEQDGILLELKLNADFAQVSSVMFPTETVVHVTRAAEALTISVDEVQDEDIITLDEAEQAVDWVVTSSAPCALPNTTSEEVFPAESELDEGLPMTDPNPDAEVDPAGDCDDEPGLAVDEDLSGGEAPLEEGEPLPEGLDTAEIGDPDGTVAVGVSFKEGTQVRLVLKPWSPVEGGQVELTGDELVKLVGPYEDFTVQTEAGDIVKEAHQLQPRDVIQITRNGAVMREVVVSADSDVFNQPADEADEAEGGRVNV